VLLPLFTGISIWHWTAPQRIASERRVEKEQCTQRLREFYLAFEAYRRDHGKYPPTPSSLYPRYLRSVEALVCPAYRPGRFALDQSRLVKVGGRSVLDTYQFPYLLLHLPSLHLRPEDVPLMVCSVHAELLYEENQRKSVEDKADFVRRHGVPELLILRRDGSIQRDNELDLPREGWRFLKSSSTVTLGHATSNVSGRRDGGATPD